MHITLAAADGVIHLRSARDRDAAVEWLVFGSEWSARSFLRQHFRDSHQMGVLRAQLASEVHGLDRLADEEIIEIAAARLANGRWRASRQADAVPQPVAVAGQRRPLLGGALRARGAGQAAPAPRAAPRAATPRPVARQASAPAQEEWPAAADQVAQAVTLEQAARGGQPFCEICERARRARQEREQEAVQEKEQKQRQEAAHG